MKHGFTLVEVMFANAMLLILVAGFAKITELTFEQIQLKTLKNELASHLDEWTLAKLNNTLNAGNYQENFFFVRLERRTALAGQTSEHKTFTLLFLVKTSDTVPKVLAQWQTKLKTQ
jgi:prepilin-type N-terminal cleavage/methylation domain-containing protein